MAAKTCTGLAMEGLFQCNELRNEEGESWLAVLKVPVVMGKEKDGRGPEALLGGNG